MTTALLSPDPEKGGRGKKAANPLETKGFSAMRLSQARTVLHFNRDIALMVRDGIKTLDAALKQVKVAQQIVQSEEQWRLCHERRAIGRRTNSLATRHRALPGENSPLASSRINKCRQLGLSPTSRRKFT
ncbi:hypothetical protein ACVWZM_002675 [Bradyrhizobium sp. USDA 4501]